METKKHIAAKLRELREDRGLKQDELGAMLSPERGGATVSSWENGRTAPDADTLLNLCQVLGVDITEFFPDGSDRRRTSLNPAERKLVDNYRRSTKEGKAAIEATARAMARL